MSPAPAPRTPALPAWDPPGHQHRLGLGPGVHLEVAPVQEEVVELDLGEIPGSPGVELGFDRLADAGHRRLGDLRLWPQRLREGGFDVSHGESSDEPGDDQGLQGVGAGHPGSQQPGGEALIGAPQLRALEGDLAGSGLMVVEE